MSLILHQTFKNAFNALLGRGEHAVTVPPMDGALKPNNEIERADVFLQADAPDNLIMVGGRLHFSSGARMMGFDASSMTATEVASFPSEVTAMAAMPDGGIAVGLSEGEIRIRGGAHSGKTIRTCGDYRCFCPTAILAIDQDTLLVTEGSAYHRADQWKHDLLKRGTSGSVWRIDLAQVRAKRIAGALAFPSGAALTADGGVVISESWRHRLLNIAPDGRRYSLVTDLPGYPSRLTCTARGDYWLTVFAPRSQLVEFVLRERRFKERMMAEMPEKYWVAPALSTGGDFREPLQGGAIKSMGILKPWAPTRSYGLLVKLNADFLPVASMHSRADGKRHGITSVLEMDGQLLFASKGGDQILRAPSYWMSR
jgi:sugar lactone lactonase YvrE